MAMCQVVGTGKGDTLNGCEFLGGEQGSYSRTFQHDGTNGWGDG